MQNASKRYINRINCKQRNKKESFFASIKLYFGRKVYKKAKRGTVHIVFLSFRIHHIMLILKC